MMLDNVRHVSGESGEFDPEAQIGHAEHHIARLSELACETVRVLAVSDGAV